MPVALTTEVARVLKLLQPLGSGVRTISPEQLHLTLCFLGDTPWELTNSVSQVIEETLHGREAIPASFGPLGGFPNLSRPRVIWAGVEPAEPITRIQEDLKRRLEDLGLQLEQRPFIPHVTLARVKGDRDIEFLDYDFATVSGSLGTVQLDEVVYFESQLGKRGPEYQILSEHYLL